MQAERWMNRTWSTNPWAASPPDTLSRYRHCGGGRGWRGVEVKESQVGKGIPGQALITQRSGRHPAESQDSGCNPVLQGCDKDADYVSPINLTASRCCLPSHKSTCDKPCSSPIPPLSCLPSAHLRLHWSLSSLQQRGSKEGGLSKSECNWKDWPASDRDPTGRSSLGESIFVIGRCAVRGRLVIYSRQF